MNFEIPYLDHCCSLVLRGQAYCTQSQFTEISLLHASASVIVDAQIHVAEFLQD